EAIDQHISLIIPVYKLDEEATIISKILNGEKIDHIDTVRKCKDGSEKNVSITISPIKDKNNRIIGASKIARDITQKVEIERQKALFAKKLGELNDFKDDFMMMASHELKTPLTVIKTSLQILQQSMATGDADIRLVNRSLHNVERLATLVSELMDVSKIKNGKIDLEISVFDLTGLLKETITDRGPVVSKHTIILSHPNKLIEIKADRKKIRQVVDNILDNALKFSPDGSEVQVEVSVKETGVIVKVRDYGIGISQEYLDKIFTRFFRVGGISSTFPGTGIGLYISAEIVRHHGGRMWAESESNKGSAFYVEIPMRLSPALSQAG
ncbi:MAG: PAS domain-containing sensor histidine kinase, partial [Ginsengibacter sp.]